MVLIRIFLSMLVLSASTILNAMENNQEKPITASLKNNQNIIFFDCLHMAQTPICHGLILFAMSDKDENIHQMVCYPKEMRMIPIRSIHKDGLTGLRFNDNRELIAIIGDREEKVVW